MNECHWKYLSYANLILILSKKKKKQQTNKMKTRIEVKIKMSILSTYGLKMCVCVRDVGPYGYVYFFVLFVRMMFCFKNNEHN